MSSACPSAAWDRHIGELDEAAAAESAYCSLHRDEIARFAAAIVASDFGRHAYLNPREVIDHAISFSVELNNRCLPC